MSEEPNTKRWIVGVTGGIAAYKTPELIRLLMKQGNAVKVVMSAGARHFVTPMTLQALSQHPVHGLGEWPDPGAEAVMGHIELARWAQGILIAPLSANRLAALALGMADDLLSTVCLATQAPIYVAPAMNEKMWDHPATVQHMETLRSRGVTILGPDTGEQACGEIGWGRMLAPEALVAALSATKSLAGLSIVVTAGPTREAIDPVRFLSNRSSGKMGFAIAAVAAQEGAKVTLIAGPVSLPTPMGVSRVDVDTAEAMRVAVNEHLAHSDMLIATAAVSDFRPTYCADQKIKKETNGETMLSWVPTVDILATMAKQYSHKFFVGFAAETQQGEQYAREKLANKKIDMVAWNDVSRSEIGFESDENELIVLTKDKAHPIPKASKRTVAVELLKIVKECYDAKNRTQNS